jgi:hypothetical protein
MVSFILDPRIPQAQEQRQLLLAKMLKGYEPPKNPYGYTAAGHLGPLMYGLGAQLLGKQTAELKTAQEGARSDLMAQILSLGEMPTGDTYTVADDGRVTPVQYTPEQVVFDPATVTAAGAREPELRLAAQQAEATARKLFDDRRERELKAGLISAEDSVVREAFRLALDPMAATKPRTPDIEYVKLDDGGVMRLDNDNGTYQVGTLDDTTTEGIKWGPVRPLVSAPGEGTPALAEKGPAEKPDAPLTAGERRTKKAFEDASIKVRAERLAQWPKFNAAYQTGIASFDKFRLQVDEALEIAKKNTWSTGVRGVLYSTLWPEGEAARLETLLDQFKAFAGFKSLSDMRAASPTGGALGGVSERELYLLIVKEFVGKLESGKEYVVADLEQFRDDLDTARRISTEAHNNWNYLIGLAGSEDVPGYSFESDVPDVAPDVVAPVLSDTDKYLQRILDLREKAARLRQDGKR